MLHGDNKRNSEWPSRRLGALGVILGAFEEYFQFLVETRSIKNGVAEKLVCKCL